MARLDQTSNSIAIDDTVLFVNTNTNRVGINQGNPSVALQVTGATTIDSGNLTLSTGSMTLTAGGITASSGTVTAGTLTDGTLSITGGTITSSTLASPTITGVIALNSNSATVPPLTLTASSLNDGVGALRIDSVEPDIYLNDTNGGFSTVSFANAGTASAAFGRNNNDDFYITVTADGSTWRNDTFVVDHDTGNIAVGYKFDVGTGDLRINGTDITATATEINQLDGVTLGTAASANTGDFATAAQGALADTALQVVAVDGVTITGDGTVGNPLVAAGGGGGGISIGDAVGSGTSGSILFVDASTNLAQDNGELYWDDTNNRLGIGTSTPQETLVVAGNVVVEDPSSTGSSDHLLEVKSGSSATPDNARILVSADTDAKLPMFNLRDIEANGGTFSPNYSAYFALDRATPIVTGSAQNDLLIANGNLNKDIHLCTNNTGDGSGAQARLTIVGSDGDVGIGTTSPSQKLHVVGTIRQTNSTNAVLVSDGNGDIGSASNLQDVAYYQPTPPQPAVPGAPIPAIGEWYDPVIPPNFMGWININGFFVPAFQ